MAKHEKHEASPRTTAALNDIADALQMIDRARDELDIKDDADDRQFARYARTIARRAKARATAEARREHEADHNGRTQTTIRFWIEQTAEAVDHQPTGGSS